MSIELHDIVMDFSGTRALANVSVEFRFDEVHGLIGENGAGKSTLVSILAGTRPQTSGSIAVDGRPLRMSSARDALSEGIALVSQEGCLVPSLTGAENILLGDEPTHAGMLQRTALLKRSRALLAEWFPGVEIDLNRPTGMLDMADQKIIEIVRALRSDIRLLILDEPTATLQAREKHLLWQIIRSLPGKGVGVVLISHFLSEVKALSDRITVLRDGAHVATRAAAELTEPEMVELMLKRGVSSEGSLRGTFPKGATPALEVTGWRAGRVEVPRFEVAPGEVVGLIGLTGAGHFGFARSLYTNKAVFTGELKVAGKPVAHRSPRILQRLGVGFVPDSRMENALMPEGTITENLSVVHPDAGKSAGLLWPRLENREASRVMTQLNVRATGPRQTIKTLSGGNKQKVSLGKWMYGATDHYKVLIFIEPTEGVDVGAKHEIYGHIKHFSEQGVAVIVATSDLLEVEQITHRVIPFVAGHPGAEIPAEAYSEQRFINAMAGEAA